VSWPRNALPSILAFVPVILLPLAQSLLRPRLSHAGLTGLILGSASDFVIGFCFPFSILIRPRLFEERTASRLFHLWCALTLIVLVVFEFRDPFGPSTFDPHDLAASIAGVALALAVFHFGLRRRLIYASPGTA
jgi:hypothetical protein